MTSQKDAVESKSDQTSKFRPEVLAWIADQARRGVHGPSVHEALVANGWHSDAAAAAMMAAITVHHPGYARNPEVSQLHPGVIPEPELLIDNSIIDLGDRRVEVVMTSLVPRVVVFDGFMTDKECDALIDAARPRMERSSVIQPMTGSGVVDDVRTSTGMFFQVGESALVSAIEARISRLVHWPVQNGEGVQVLNYQVGAEYKPHQDYFDPTDPGTPKQLGMAGQRVGTVVMYLNTPRRGGGTVFPDAGGLEVRAKKGRAVLFSYDQPNAQKRVLHGGMPVLEGEKWAATKWLRQMPVIPQGVPAP